MPDQQVASKYFIIAAAMVLRYPVTLNYRPLIINRLMWSLIIVMLFLFQLIFNIGCFKQIQNATKIYFWNILNTHKFLFWIY